MGIELKHPRYKSREIQWARCRDTYHGEDEVKDAGETYLPKLSGQGKDSYNAYKKRASFYNAVRRTVSGLVGAVMRVPPIIDGVNDDWVEDITLTGVALGDFISVLLTEQLLMGRQGILVDHDGTRPYLTGYATEDITNWMPGRIILKEQYRGFDPVDIYKSSYEDQYRELVLEEGKYIVRIWHKKDHGDWKVFEEIAPRKRGALLEELPFVALSVDGLNLNPEVPPLLSLADMNLSHYRTSADLEHGRHFTALPTPYVTGIETGTQLHIGPESAWILPTSDSRAGYLEFSGQGLKALEVAMQEKRSMMASLGAQLIEGQKSGVEASETLRLRQNSEVSVLMSAVKGVETGLNKALGLMAEWDGAKEASIVLNTDFSDTKMEPQEMTALMQAWQAGALSHETYLFNMKKGEILEPEIKIEEERDRIAIQSPLIEEPES